MNIFEQLDILLKSTNKLNESVTYEDLPIEPSMETAEQAREYIRDYFKSVLEDSDDSEPGGDFGTPPDTMPVTPPPPPFSKEKKKMSSTGGDDEKIWSDKDLEWEDDDFLKRLEIEAEELEKGEDGEEGESYDDFTDKSPKGVSEGGGDDDDEGNTTEETEGSGGIGKEKSSPDKTEKKSDDDISTDDTKDGEEDDDVSGEGSEKGESGEGSEKGESSKGESGEGSKKDGGSSSDDELKKTIEDALKELSERNESEKEDLKELLDMLEDEKTDVEDIEEKERKFDEEKESGKEKLDKLKSLVGRIEKAPTKEEIDKEVEASKLSKEEIEDLKSKTSEAAEDVTPPTDEELDSLKKEAMKELDKKCKGHSKLSSSILYHSLKTPKIDKEDWDRILEKVLKKKSKHISKDDKSKSRKVILGDKNHIWRDVRYGYKTVKGGSDKQSIYCFIDYSATVKYEKGLIVTFLGKILEMTQKLKYTDLHLYTFADRLSVPRIINEEMISKEGYETVLADTIKFFELPENDVGGAIEDFSLVGYEINRIKKNDRNAIIFIFGDGIWTFYGNWNPPTKLNEICPRWIKDIIAFVFYKNENSFKINKVGKEISQLKDVVGIQDVIVTKASEMKE